jgi:hypothetical protein
LRASRERLVWLPMPTAAESTHLHEGVQQHPRADVMRVAVEFSGGPRQL